MQCLSSSSHIIIIMIKLSIITPQSQFPSWHIIICMIWALDRKHKLAIYIWKTWYVGVNTIIWLSLLEAQLCLAQKKIWSFLVVSKLSQNGQCWKRVWSNRALSDSSDCDISQSEIVSTGPNSDCHCLRDLNVRLDAFPSSGFSVLVVIIIDIWSPLPSYHHCVTIWLASPSMVSSSYHDFITTRWPL